MILFALIFCHTWPQQIIITEPLVGISKVVSLDDDFYLLDRRGKGLYLFDARGNLLRSKTDLGSGPGEFVAPHDLAVFNNKVYITDLRKQRLIVLDQNLAFLEEHIMPGLCRKVEATKEGIFVLLFHAVHETMIVKFDTNWQVAAFFGEAMEPVEKLFGSQAGSMIYKDGSLYFIHLLRPVLEHYDSNGKLIEKFPLPGFDSTFLTGVDINDLNVHQQIKKRVYDLLLEGDLLQVLIHDAPSGHVTAHSFNTHTKEWQGRPFQPPPTILLGNKRYQVSESDQGYTLKRLP